MRPNTINTKGTTATATTLVEKDNIEAVLSKAQEIISTDKWWFEQLEGGRDPSDIEKEKPLP